MSDEEIKNKLLILQKELNVKIKERAQAAIDGGGWHDNSAFDLLNEELLVLESRIRELKEQL